jgi:fatty acyl-CoA reductase
MMRKLVPITGNVCESNLGMDPYTANEIANEVDVIINSAASTSFDERFLSISQQNVRL